MGVPKFPPSFDIFVSKIHHTGLLQLWILTCNIFHCCNTLRTVLLKQWHCIHLIHANLYLGSSIFTHFLIKYEIDGQFFLLHIIKFFNCFLPPSMDNFQNKTPKPRFWRGHLILPTPILLLHCTTKPSFKNWTVFNRPFCR